MEYRKLGRTDLKVSALCLGTMTWGSQNTQEEAFEQLDYALGQGINFIDTAEIYAVPPTAETSGSTERMVGNWLEARNNRSSVILASKVAGPGAPFIRGGGNNFSADRIEEALDSSLKRLKTDYLDLYQLHWPERGINIFGRHGLGDAKIEENSWNAFEDVLGALQTQVDKGKIRHVGLSNETPWGSMEYLRLSKEGKGPRMVSIQNAYNLLNRTFELGLSEIAHYEDLGLLAYAPLAAGVLSGKYLQGQRPQGARFSVYPQSADRYFKAQVDETVVKYLDLAKKHDLDPTIMANAFVMQRPFVTSSIIGATSVEQLKTNISCAEVTLSDELLKEIDQIHAVYSNLCP